MTNHKQIQGPNPDNDQWFARLPEDEQEVMDLAVVRANRAMRYVETYGLPEAYHGIAERYNEFIRRNGADRANIGATVTDEHVYEIDQTVAGTVYDNDIFGQMMGPVQSTMTVPKWQTKDYLVKDKVWPSFTRYFRNPAFIRLAQSSGWTEGIGLALGYQMPWTEIEEARGDLIDPLAMAALRCATKMGIMKSRRGFLGTSCLNAVGDDGTNASGYGITGLFNDAGNQTEAVGDRTNNDEAITAAGELTSSVEQLLEDLVAVRTAHQKILVTTPGIYCEGLIHRDTYTRRHELSDILEDHFGVRNGGYHSSGAPPQPGGDIAEWWITSDLYAGTLTTATQQMMLWCRAPDLVTHKIIYPQQTVSMLAGKVFEKDVSELMLFADQVVIHQQDTTVNCVPVTVNAASCTTTLVGWVGASQRIV